jgi:hypothetical protein
MNTYSCFLIVNTYIRRLPNSTDNCSRTASVHRVCINIQVIFRRIRISINTPYPHYISFNPCHYVRWWKINHRHYYVLTFTSKALRTRNKTVPLRPNKNFRSVMCTFECPTKSEFRIATVRPPSMASWSKTKKKVHKCYNHSANT